MSKKTIKITKIKDVNFTRPLEIIIFENNNSYCALQSDFKIKAYGDTFKESVDKVKRKIVDLYPKRKSHKQLEKLFDELIDRSKKDNK